MAYTSRQLQPSIVGRSEIGRVVATQLAGFFFSRGPLCLLLSSASLASFPAEGRSLNDLSDELSKIASNYEKMQEKYEPVSTLQAGLLLDWDLWWLLVAV